MLSACSFLYVLVESPLQLIALRLLEGIAWSILWPIIDVSISEDVSRESNKALSIYNTVWSSAGAAGPLLGGFLIILFTQIRYTFLVTGLMMVVAAIVMSSFFHEVPRVPPAESYSGRETPNTSEVKVTKSGRRASRFWIFLVAMILISSIRGVLFTFYPPLAQSQGVSLAFIALIGFVFGASRVGVFALSMRDDVRGFLLHDGNTKKIVMVSLAVCAIGGALPLMGDPAPPSPIPTPKRRSTSALVFPETSNDVSKNFGVQDRYVTKAPSARKAPVAISITVLLPSRLLNCPFGDGGESPAFLGITAKYATMVIRPPTGMIRSASFQS
jgi:MFS family permease